jgi:hypothetical protein
MKFKRSLSALLVLGFSTLCFSASPDYCTFQINEEGGSAGQCIGKIVNQQTGDGDFNITAGSYANPYGTRNNFVINMGHNISPTLYAHENNAYTYSKLGFESHYAPSSTFQTTEIYFEFAKPGASPVILRPFQANYEQIGDTLTNYFTGTEHIFFFQDRTLTNAGTPLFTIASYPNGSPVIGIGTLAPETAFHILVDSNISYGAIKIQGVEYDNSGIGFFPSASTTAMNNRAWQIQSNYERQGNLDIMMSTTNTGNPTTKVASFTNAGYFGVGTVTPHSTLAVTDLPVYPNNAAAIAGGLTPGDFYRTGADPDPVCVVH